MDQFERNVSAGFRTLLQEKHLYQSLEIEPTHTYNVMQLGGERGPTTDSAVATFILKPWRFEKPPSTDRWCCVTPPDIKLFCSTCDRVEPYNLQYADDVYRRMEQVLLQTKGETDQAFVFGYKCQSCKGTPEVFLVRRRGLRLTIEGRSPIEHVDVPRFVPKAVKPYLGGAVVAHQSGQTLAGLFLLRTLIEQWARLSTASTNSHADAIIDDYMAALPIDFKERFPSMRDLYGELSVDLHAAIGSAKLFDKSHVQIVQHFDARRLFKLPGLAATPPVP